MTDSPELPYVAPKSYYYKTKEEFDQAVGLDFIRHANEATRKGKRFLVGLSHGQSPSGAYDYILQHYSKLSRPENIRYTFVNSKLNRQRGLKDVTDAVGFLKALLADKRISKNQILGRTLNRDNMAAYCKEMNEKISRYLIKLNKKGLDYMFIATDPAGRVAGITRNSKAFAIKEMGCVVTDGKEQRLTLTPWFIKKTARIAFLATMSEKRRALAWLYYRWGKPNESPSFLRFIDRSAERLAVFIEDKALTWPQVVVKRQTPYGETVIRIDVANRFNEKAKKKLPVVLLIHGFLGLNTFDGLLTSISTQKYIAAAMHYGSVPNDLPIEEYSEHVVKNIDATVQYFGELGHSVYIFDHSMGNVYFLMMEKMFAQLPGISNYLCGRIGANPFFGQESRHAMVGFMDNVILPSEQGVFEKAFFLGIRQLLPFQSKVGVRNIGISLSQWLIREESALRNRAWKAVKSRILYLMSNMGSLPDLNRIPIERALSRLPAKLFAIQTHSVLKESKAFDKLKGLPNMKAHDIPVLILKSDCDAVAKYVPRIYDSSHAIIIDITDEQEKDLFREHLYHMVNPRMTTMIIDEFIIKVEERRAKKKEIARDDILV